MGDVQVRHLHQCRAAQERGGGMGQWHGGSQIALIRQKQGAQNKDARENKTNVEQCWGGPLTSAGRGREVRAGLMQKLEG